MITLVCKECNKKFKVYSYEKNKLFCDNKCYRKYNVKKNHPSYKGKIILVCKQCGKNFEVYPYLKHRQFCSHKCFIKHNIGKNHHMYKEKITLICKQCGKVFKIRNSLKGQQFCSYECKNKNQINKIEKECLQCGKIHKNNLFCSLECSQKYHTKENNTSWQGGISFKPYCYKFNNELKIQIRNRDNNICQLCGKTKEQNNQELTVHHIHYDKENCNPDLITVCHSCNTKVNYNRDYWEEYFMRQLAYRGLVKIYSLNEIGVDY